MKASTEATAASSTGLAALRAAIERDEDAALVLVYSPTCVACSPLEAVDLLERAAAWGRRRVVDALYDAKGALYQDEHPFVYESFALALALRYAHEDVARDLLDRGVDLLAKPHQPQGMRAMLPPDDTFTRFGLTRQSATLFLNPMDPTVSTEVFRDPHTHEELAGTGYFPARDLAASCELVRRLAAEGLFDATVYDDLFRAALAASWHALRHGNKDENTAATCLALCDNLLEIHRAHTADPRKQVIDARMLQDDFAQDGSGRFGDGRLYELMEKMIVPRGDPHITLWVCERSPRVFLRALSRLDWLREETSLVTDAAECIVDVYDGDTGSPSAGTKAQADIAAAPTADVACLLTTLAEAGALSLVKAVSDLPQVDSAALETALEAASAAGHADVAAWLLERMTTPGDPTDNLDDLLL